MPKSEIKNKKLKKKFEKFFGVKSERKKKGLNPYIWFLFFSQTYLFYLWFIAKLAKSSYGWLPHLLHLPLDNGHLVYKQKFLKITFIPYGSTIVFHPSKVLYTCHSISPTSTMLVEINVFILRIFVCTSSVSKEKCEKMAIIPKKI